ncbi:DUF6221 family protein [Streptomyces mirabilis]|uniref:DUF6221 family protein n=1 Tax=Streptomyces mirabilis TaxID=68239 RepID=UPI0036A04C3E
MDELVRWLGEQLDEDERIARSAGGVVYLGWAEGGWVEAEIPKTEWKGPGDDGRHVGSVRRAEDRAHIARHDPARVLREIEAKRRIVDRYAWLREHGDTGGTAWVLPLLALPYADRPGYREEWRP